MLNRSKKSPGLLLNSTVCVGASVQVQSGVGRTGKWWGHQHMEGVDADIMTFAKGIGSGFPMAGLATRHNLFAGVAPGTLVGLFQSCH